MKKIIILLFAAICSLFASAQTTHEVSINSGGGLSTLNYKLSSGERNLGFGGDFGLGYTGMFGEHVGIYIGIDLGFYNAKAKLNGVTIVTGNLRDSDSKEENDSKGDRFDLYTTLNKYTETQKAMFLNIPVMAQFQTKGRQKFYMKAGVKIGIPINCKYSVSNANITNEAYYPDYDNWLPMPAFAGFGSFTKNSERKLKVGVAAMLALETGVKWSLGEKVALYTGAYFDYGLNNVLKDSHQPFVNYHNSEPATFTINSALPSLTDKMNLMAAGIKLRIAFKPGKNNSYSAKTTMIIPEQKTEEVPAIEENPIVEQPKKEEVPIVEQPNIPDPEKPQVETIAGEVNAQAIIKKCTGEEIQAIVQDIGNYEVTYKLSNKSDEEIKILKKNLIFSILFSNGDREMFNCQDVTDFKQSDPTQGASLPDLIILTNGEVVEGFVMKVGRDEVEYKKAGNPNGPTYKLKRASISKIQYANGKIFVR